MGEYAEIISLIQQNLEEDENNCILTDEEREQVASAVSAFKSGSVITFNTAQEFCDHTRDAPVLYDFLTKILSESSSGWKVCVGSSKTKKAIKKRWRTHEERIVDAVSKILDNPMSFDGQTIKPLTGDMKGFWRYRMGDYRLIYMPDHNNQLVTILSFGHRKDVYSR